MSLITLVAGKAHLRVLNTHEDVLIQSKLDAATLAAGRFMSRLMDGSDPEITQTDPIDPANQVFVKDVEAAILLIAEDLFTNRGIQQTALITPTNSAGGLLLPFQRMVV